MLRTVQFKQLSKAALDKFAEKNQIKIDFFLESISDTFGCILFSFKGKTVTYFASFPIAIVNSEEIIIYFDFQSPAAFSSDRRSISSFKKLPLTFREALSVLAVALD